MNFACYNPTLTLGTPQSIIDGGSVWVRNLYKAYQGTKKLISLNEQYNEPVVIQSEWAITKAFQSPQRKILLGHFKEGVYPNPHQEGELYTAWTGKCTKGFNATFLPHAYSVATDDGTANRNEGIVWTGNKYGLRSEDWLEGLPLQRFWGVHPDLLFKEYRGNVVANIHGDFQKGKVSQDPTAIATKPGEMINERFWNALGAGGILVTDWVPQMGMFFEEEELITAHSKDEFQEKCLYFLEHRAEGLKKLEKARARVRELHTYNQRIKVLCKD